MKLTEGTTITTPAAIPGNISGTNFKIPEYEPKEVKVSDDTSIWTENYTEEVRYILDPDGDGKDEDGNKVSEPLYYKNDIIGKCYLQYDKNGNKVAEYHNYGDNETTDIAHYYEYDENGNELADYVTLDNNRIHDAFYYEYDKNGNKVAELWNEGNNETIDSAKYFKYNENGQMIARYYDSGNNGIDEASYNVYDENGNEVQTYYDCDYDGVIDDTLY